MPPYRIAPSNSVPLVLSAGIIRAAGDSGIQSGKLDTHAYHNLFDLSPLVGTTKLTGSREDLVSRPGTLRFQVRSGAFFPLNIDAARTKLQYMANTWTAVYTGRLGVKLEFWTSPLPSAGSDFGPPPSSEPDLESEPTRTTDEYMLADVTLTYTMRGIKTPAGVLLPDQTSKGVTALGCYRAGDPPTLICIDVQLRPLIGSAKRPAPIALALRSQYPILGEAGSYNPTTYEIEAGGKATISRSHLQGHVLG